MAMRAFSSPHLSVVVVRVDIEGKPTPKLLCVDAADSAVKRVYFVLWRVVGHREFSIEA